MRLPHLRRLLLVGTALLAPSFARTDPAAADEPPATIEALQARIDDAALDDRAREDAAEALAEMHHRPEVLVPWLKEWLGKEKSFHVKLALAYALAAQGFGGPGVGWNAPAWEQWLANLDAEAWRELQRKRHLPRVPLDADAAGLAKAVAWWDALEYPDVGTLPFVCEAAQGAEPRIDARLLEALAPLARPDVQDYLLLRAPEGPFVARLAAAASLHAQGRHEGLDLLLAEWPASSEARTRASATAAAGSTWTTAGCGRNAPGGTTRADRNWTRSCSSPKGRRFG